MLPGVISPTGGFKGGTPSPKASKLRNRTGINGISGTCFFIPLLYFHTNVNGYKY